MNDESPSGAQSAKSENVVNLMNLLNLLLHQVFSSGHQQQSCAESLIAPILDKLYS